RGLQTVDGPPELGPVGGGLGFGSAPKASREAAVRTANGVQHEDGALASVQTDRFVDLLEDEGAVELLLGRCQRLGSPGDPDRVRLNDPDALEQLPGNGVEAVVEAAHDRRVAPILLSRRIEVKYLAHRGQHGHGRGLLRLRLADQGASVSAFSTISRAACGRASRRALSRIAAARAGSSSRRSIL